MEYNKILLLRKKYIQGITCSKVYSNMLVKKHHVFRTHCSNDMMLRDELMLHYGMLQTKNESHVKCFTL